MESLEIPLKILNELPNLWTFILLLTRYGACMLLLPGIGGGLRGTMVRLPAMIVFSLASMPQSPTAELPANLVLLAGALISEAFLGAVIAFFPLLIVVGAQMAAHLASTSMGLGANQLIDPTSGSNVSDLARIVGDVAVLTFLALGGHHVALWTLAGLGGQIQPGTFFIGEGTIQLLIHQTGQVFRSAAMLSAPVIVALLLTQFVMGLVSRAVPTVNIFIVSFPLTIGIGLIVTALALPDTVLFLTRSLNSLEPSMLLIVADTQQVASAN